MNTKNESLVSTPLRIKGVAMKVGISRNNALFTKEWMEDFKNKLLGAPVYVDHITTVNAIGKVINTFIQGDELLYEADIYDDKLQLQAKNGLVQHVSIGFDYKSMDMVNGHQFFNIPSNAELSLVAIPGIPETSIATESLMHFESLDAKIELVHVEPFAGYTDFADCVAKNQDKSDPQSYCGYIKHQAEAKAKEWTWDACITKMTDEGYDPDTAAKICGMIKNEKMEESLDPTKKEEPKKPEDRIKELEEAYSKVIKTNEDLKKNLDDSVKKAKEEIRKETKKEILDDFKTVIPQEWIKNQVNKPTERLIEELKRKVREHEIKE